jgi:two-component system response regulator VanR
LIIFYFGLEGDAVANILIVDDEKEIADLVSIYLGNEDFNVYKYYSSNDVLRDLNKMDIDLAILDVMMPEIDGFELCHRIREKYTFPIIFATAKVEDMDKITGLTIGADDYVTKPFQPLELVARVKAQLRRYQKYNNNKKEENVIDFRGILINNDTHEFYFNERLVELTKTEFSILWLLCENRGNVVKSDELFMNVWKEKYYKRDNNTIMVHIRHLREKMNDSGRNPKYIKTIYGVGYKIEK